jgi:polyisoprenyl-phosphate glycosyltransferase
MSLYDCVIITPCYNENVAIIQFLNELDLVLSQLNYKFLLVVVDDASTDNTLQLLHAFSFQANNVEKKVITLRYNLGHQKAIYQGLSFAADFDSNRYIVIDSDGEDDPNAIKSIINRQEDIVFVTRGKRSESFNFKLSYYTYQLMFKLVTNKSINFGNYTMISRRCLNAVVGKSYIHYSAFLSKLRLSSFKVKYDRRKRLDGKSKMNYHSLVMHGLNSLVEYADDLLLFFMRLFLLSLVLLVGFGMYILYHKFITQAALLGWASSLGASILNASLIILGIIVLGLLLLNLKEHERRNDLIYREIE